MIATGLPNFIGDRIGREDLRATEDLFNELRSLEHLTKKNDNRKEILKPKPTGKPEKKPCSLCEKASRGIRYHPEAHCWFNSKDSVKTNNIESIHNGELEICEKFTDPKN